MVFYLAFKNIARNKTNNLIIVILIAVICFFFFIGNSVIEKSNTSLYEAFISSLTGDIVIQKRGDVTMNLFGANTPVIEEFFAVPVFPSYESVMDIVRAEEGVKEITSQISGRAYLDSHGLRSRALLCGVDTKTYFSMFPGIILEEGDFLHFGEIGAMITMERAQNIKEQTGIYPKIGDPLLFTSGGILGFKLREVPLTGIFKYKNPGLFMNDIIIIDPETVRALNSIQVAITDIELTEESIFLLNVDIDDIFHIEYSTPNETVTDGFSVNFLQTWLAESTIDNINITDGDWNFIILNLNDNVNTTLFINSLNKKLLPFDVVAVDWRTSAGVSTILLLLLQVLFNAGIFLVCIAGVISVINILLISVFRRTREIGTLRAIGTSGIYVSSLILCENIILSVIAGFTSLLLGAFFIGWINSLSFHIPNELISSLLGGDVLKLSFLPNVAFISFILAVFLGLIVSIYPIYVTLKIEPIEAVRQG